MTNFNQQLKQTQEKVKRDTEVFNKYGYKSDLLIKMDEIKKSHVNRSERWNNIQSLNY